MRAAIDSAAGRRRPSSDTTQPCAATRSNSTARLSAQPTGVQLRTPEMYEVPTIGDRRLQRLATPPESAAAVVAPAAPSWTTATFCSIALVEEIIAAQYESP